MTDHSRRILIVDDNRTIHDDIRRIVGGRATRATAPPGAARPPDVAFELSSAYQAAEGVELVRAAVAAGRPYALALVAIPLPPGVDGPGTIARMWDCAI